MSSYVCFKMVWFSKWLGTFIFRDDEYQRSDRKQQKFIKKLIKELERCRAAADDKKRKRDNNDDDDEDQMKNIKRRKLVWLIFKF